MGLRIAHCGLLGFALLVIAGCSNDASVEEPVVLGAPPDTAYLGVEYAYNFGAYGGDEILDFTLANAPSWLAFEDTSNKARTGVILRGVPGITGGRRGDKDLGLYERISVNATDGSRLGGNFFDITVENNELSLQQEATVIEGQSYLPESAKQALARATEAGHAPGRDFACNPPDVDGTGSYLARGVRVYDNAGGYTVTDRTYETRPIVLGVTLAHPSVEPVTVAFEVSSAFRCDAEAEPSDCEYAGPNQDEAKPLEDFVTSSGSLSPAPPYLQYTSESEGLLTFEPGKTTCFIRLEVIDDGLPEIPEGFVGAPGMARSALTGAVPVQVVLAG